MSCPAHERPPRVLIAGGAGGVGLACADSLTGQGAELILCDIDGIALTRTAERLHASARFCDAIEENSVAIFAADIAETFPSIDVLINAAGRGYVRALAMMRMTRAFMPLLRRASGQRLLINVAPAGGFVASDGMFPYASSLGAFERLSDALAEQVKGTSIEVVTIAPKLMRGRLASDCPSNQLYQLQRVDEQHTADRVAALVEAARGRANSRRAPPDRGSASWSC
jgi:NAD(P)-dependent dehydrogenase (short-subunit alcohol dehydrogenase family)